MPVFLVFISNSPHQAVNLILPRIAAHCLEESVFVVLSHPLVHFVVVVVGVLEISACSVESFPSRDQFKMVAATSTFGTMEQL